MQAPAQYAAGAAFDMPNQPSEEEMNHGKPRRARKWTASRLRIVVYLLVLLAVAGWKFLPSAWHPSVTLQTPHYTIFSTATRQETDETARVMEFLYTAYSNRLGSLTEFQRDHARLKVKLFKDRTEFRRINRNLGWVEAFYREPYCYAYFSSKEMNPYHWMLHEAVHQLNNEVAHLKLEKWLNEGLAEYFSTSRLMATNLAVGQIDSNTYPVWWIDDIATTTRLEENIRNGSVIPLRAIVTNRGGPSLNRKFNLYYLHWWTLTYFIFEDARYRGHALELMRRGGSLESFEQLIGPVEDVQKQWHSYVRALKAKLSAQDLKSQRVPFGLSEGR